MMPFSLIVMVRGCVFFTSIMVTKPGLTRSQEEARNTYFIVGMGYEGGTGGQLGSDHGISRV
jgi:hypothetical protein